MAEVDCVLFYVNFIACRFNHFSNMPISLDLICLGWLPRENYKRLTGMILNCVFDTSYFLFLCFHYLHQLLI